MSADYLQGQIGTHLLRTGSWTKPTQVRVALFIGDPEDGGVEVSGPGYARVVFGPGDAYWSAVVSASQNNLQDIVFGLPTADWGTADYAALYDQGSNRFASSALAAPITIVAGSTPPTIVAGGLVINYV